MIKLIAFCFGMTLFSLISMTFWGFVWTMLSLIRAIIHA